MSDHFWLDWSKLTDIQKKTLFGKVCPPLWWQLDHSFTSDRSSTTRESQSSKGTRTIGQRKKSQRLLPVDDGRTHIALETRPALKSTPTTQLTLQRGIRTHHAVDGILFHNLLNTKVRVRGHDAPENRRKTSVSMFQSPRNWPTSIFVPQALAHSLVAL